MCAWTAKSMAIAQDRFVAFLNVIEICFSFFIFGGSYLIHGHSTPTDDSIYLLSSSFNFAWNLILSDLKTFSLHRLVRHLVDLPNPLRYG